MYCCARGIGAAFVYLVLLYLYKFGSLAKIVYPILKEGAECHDRSTGTTGTCVALTNCDYALDLIDNGKRPRFCNYGGAEAEEHNFNALVCCHNPESLRRRLSFEKCKEYNPELYKDFSAVSPSGGKKARPKEYKHMALVGYGETTINWACGGSLISNKFVLTAAHCIITVAGEPQLVRLGELDRETDQDDADPQDFKVIKSIAHPGYQIPSIYNDIGLLELDRQVKFSWYIRPACLPQSRTDPNKSAIATGWGHTSFGGKSSSHLIEVKLTVVSHTRCNKVFQGTNRKRLSAGINDKTQMCAGSNDGQDTCQGDSGGPLQVVKPESVPFRSVYDVIGITSFGVACGIASTPAVYTRVFFYLDWLESIVWP